MNGFFIGVRVGDDHESHFAGSLTIQTGPVVLRSLGGVSTAPDTTVALDDRFARELPELAVRWQAETAPDPQLLVLNEPLASQLGLDPQWLRSSEGLRFLLGNLVPERRHPGGAGLCRTSVRRVRPAPGRRARAVAR